MEKPNILHEFPKNVLERVRIEVSPYKETDYINVRIYFQSGIDNESWIPTKKGITIPLDSIEELKKGIDKAHTIWLKEKSQNS
jgi:hypothetical protein